MVQKILQHKIFLSIEFLLLCVLLPTTIIAYVLAPYMFSFLWGSAAYCFLIFYFGGYFENWKKLWGWKEVNWANLKPILIRWIICTILMISFTYFYDPDRLFYIWHHRPEIIPGLLAGYPVLSALPQEFIFCSFFFVRYAPFFKGKWSMIIASAVVFAYAHVLFINPVAPTLGFIAGLIFAITYWKTRSLALVTIEHGLYGNSLFLIGLGWYFWSGSVLQ